MIISLRKKEQPICPPAPALNDSIDESFAESTVSKRFTRKKNTSNDNIRGLRPSRPEQPQPQGSRSKEKERGQRLSNNFIKADDLFIRIAHTPTKNKNYYAPLSSDRATESTYPKSRFETESALFQLRPSDKEYGELRQQLELKNSEIMLLEDEIMRLKREACFKEEENIKMSIKKQKQYHIELDKLREEGRFLKSEVQEKTNEIRNLRKAQTVLNRQIKSLKYDKLLLQKQLEQIYKKKLSKDMKDLMSFRQISLMKQIEQLKLQLEQSKSDNEVKMEAEIQRLKEENRTHTTSVKNFEVHSRILNRKLAQCESELREKTENFGKCYLSMKESHSDLMEQLKKARKENIKLRRLHILSHSHTKKKLPNMHSSSEESLSLSLSSN